MKYFASVMVEIVPIVEEVSRMFPLNKEDREDLRQDLVLKCYDDQERTLSIHARNELKYWLYRVARNKVISDKRQNNTRRTSEYSEITSANDQHRFLHAKGIKEMIDLLNEKERLWINLWLKCGMSTSKLEQVTKEKGIKITRQHASIRIKAILEKWKHLEIFLPSSD